VPVQGVSPTISLITGQCIYILIIVIIQVSNSLIELSELEQQKQECICPKFETARRLYELYIDCSVSGCTDDGYFTINMTPMTCAEAIMHYTELCFTRDQFRDRWCCKSCHEAGLVQPTPGESCFIALFLKKMKTQH